MKADIGFYIRLVLFHDFYNKKGVDTLYILSLVCHFFADGNE